MNELNTSTEATITDETAIGFIPCYRLPFLRQKDVEIWNESNLETMNNMPDNHIDLTEKRVEKILNNFEPKTLFDAGQ